MNKSRRKALEGIIEKIRGLKEELDDVKDEEQEALDNLPQGIQESERGEEMMNGIEVLEDAGDDLESIICNLEELVE